MTDSFLGCVIGVLVAVALVFTIQLLNDKLDGPGDCRPVSYEHGAWSNPHGDVVAVAPTEDSVLHYVAPCN